MFPIFADTFLTATRLGERPHGTEFRHTKPISKPEKIARGWFWLS